MSKTIFINLKQSSQRISYVVSQTTKYEWEIVVIYDLESIKIFNVRT